MRIKCLLVVLVSMISLDLFSREIISLSDYGIRPNTKENIIPLLNKVIDDIKGRKVELRFEPGRYDFYSPQSGLVQRSDIYGCVFKGLDSLYFNANGAEFIAHGQISPFVFKDCKNLVVEGFSIDWERPLISQGIIVEQNPEYIDIQFDRKLYPFRQEGDKVLFYGENWEADVCPRSYSTIHSFNGDILPGTKDMFLSPENTLFRGKQSIIGDNTVRFFGKAVTTVPNGSIISLYHGVYMGYIIVFEDCKDVIAKNIDIHHSCGIGIHPFFVDGIILDNINFSPSKGRVFTAVADATHFSNCKGEIEIRNCSFEGQGDDATNIHGRYFKLLGKPCENKFISISSSRGYQDVPKIGDEMWLIDPNSLSRIAKVVVSDVKASLLWAQVKFSSAPEIDRDDLYIENATWVPSSVKIYNNYFAKSNRARGVLLTTPAKMQVFDNHFRSAGAAILLEGDLTYWYESGAIADLEIFNNIFENCATSVRDTITNWGWGEAVITITPSSSGGDTCYHKNIKIFDNKFIAFDLALLYARSVDGLSFTNNTIIQSRAYPRILSQKSAISLSGCKNVEVSGNLCFTGGHPQTPALSTFPYFALQLYH